MKQCFCGCGRTVRRFPLGMRSVNGRGRYVRERLDWAEDTCRDLDPAWAQQGETFLLHLRAAVHGEIEPAEINALEPEVRSWQRHGRELEHQAVGAGAPSMLQWLANRPTKRPGG